ncbi:MAG: hypothetical protein DCC43_14985 [Candidatus Brocadia sp.]|nr:transposase family protein [Candidatus Brocadia sp.]MDG5995479.1 transposase family protein [Candidatus Brocadia sp.]RIJ90178.1 MAG: hypothetical protein DCC43_14985 [Candidatus Brocadia sp.]
MHGSYYDKRVRWIRDLSCGDARIYLEVEVRRVLCRKCGKMKRERLEWVAQKKLLATNKQLNTAYVLR